MKKYKQITHMQELQQKLDKTYGKGLYKAGFVLLLFSCLFFTSCVPDSRSTMPTGRQEIPASSSEQEPSSSSNTSSRSSSSSSNTSSSSSTSSEARIKITDPNQTNSPNNLYGSDPAVLDAYFAREDKTSGTYKRIKSAAIGDTVFIVVDTANLSSRTIKVTIKDEKQIIKTEKIPFLQYKIKGDNTFEETPIDVSGEFSTKVRNDKRFALYKIVLKAKEDETTKKWKDEISKHTDKKLKLCLTVTVEGEEVIYCGSNFAKEEQRAKDKESNVWLNMDKKWFEVSPNSCFCNRDFTIDDLISFNIPRNRAEEYLEELNNTLNIYNINTCIRKIHFLAQLRHESGEFLYREEIASGAAYEGRRDLGNTQPGDGIRFKGRGLIQITGRNNYSDYGTFKNTNFTNEPNNLRLAELPYCADSAGWYWSDHLNVNLNSYADVDDLLYITYRINGGFIGLIHDRKPKLIQMINNITCPNANYRNFDGYAIRNSECWSNYKAVYKYARLDTDESRVCYQQFLDLTENYLNWNSISGWQTNSDKRKLKERIESQRNRANNVINNNR